MTPEPPSSVRRIIEAMTAQAVARCAREEYSLEAFYAAMLREQELDPTVSVTRLFELTFLRLKREGN
jgi:hypothetical protein